MVSMTNKGWEKAAKTAERFFCHTCSVTGFEKRQNAFLQTEAVEVEKGTFPARAVWENNDINTERILADVEKQGILLYPRDQSITAGDWLTIRYEDGTEETAEAGESIYYRTHRACMIFRKKKA